jgi:hypothetical protein
MVRHSSQTWFRNRGVYTCTPCNLCLLLSVCVAQGPALLVQRQLSHVSMGRKARGMGRLHRIAVHAEGGGLGTFVNDSMGSQ